MKLKNNSFQEYNSKKKTNQINIFVAQVVLVKTKNFPYWICYRSIATNVKNCQNSVVCRPRLRVPPSTKRAHAKLQAVRGSASITITTHISPIPSTSMLPAWAALKEAALFVAIKWHTSRAERRTWRPFPSFLPNSRVSWEGNERQSTGSRQ